MRLGVQDALKALTAYTELVYPLSWEGRRRKTALTMVRPAICDCGVLNWNAVSSQKPAVPVKLHPTASSPWACVKFRSFDVVPLTDASTTTLSSVGRTTIWLGSVVAV